MRKHILLFIIAIFGVMIFTGCSLADNKTAMLCEAIENGNNEEAIRIAEGMRNLNTQSSRIPRITELLEGEVTTPLVKACETGNAQMILWLLEHGARTDYAPGRICYPLEAFCESGSGAGIETLKSLIAYGADPEQYKYRPAMFRLAQTLNHRNAETYQTGVDMVMMLIDNGASWQDAEDGYTILHYAAMQKDGSFLRSLLEKEEAQKYINARNNKGETPMDVAVQSRSVDTVWALQEAGGVQGDEHHEQEPQP